MDKKIQNIMLVILLVLIPTGSLLFYFNYSIKIAKQDYEAKISDLSKKTAENLQDLGVRIDALGANLSSQIGFVDASLRSFKKQNQQEIKTLSDLIDEIERQSDIRLSELKNELKDIRIKSADFSAIVDDVLQSVVSVQTNVGQGSGAIIDAKGYIVTNVHVISGASTIKALTYSGKTYNANTIAGYDPDADIAVLKIDATGLSALDFGDSGEVKVGEKVIAAGNPAGLAFTVTEGIVSAFRLGSNNLKYIQTDVPINPGNSGGPLINTKGEIIGINNFKVGGDFEGLGFAISSNDASRIASKIISDYEAQQNQ
ncbi:trypsin-like peptidase domain-containing protein [Candidatus Woesearchaeota archaeon]|nr:trypsin-like peptidase domain-containing protein [Candidatus Woesearchaeota archaeon]